MDNPCTYTQRCTNTSFPSRREKKEWMDSSSLSLFFTSTSFAMSNSSGWEKGVTVRTRPLRGRHSRVQVLLVSHKNHTSSNPSAGSYLRPEGILCSFLLTYRYRFLEATWSRVTDRISSSRPRSSTCTGNTGNQCTAQHLRKRINDICRGLVETTSKRAQSNKVPKEHTSNHLVSGRIRVILARTISTTVFSGL